jgi:glutaredoxin
LQEGIIWRMAPLQRHRAAILILGRDTCDDTTRSRDHLAAIGRSFRYLRVDEVPAADAWIRRLNGGEWLTPTILIGDPEAPTAILREPTNDELDAALAIADAATAPTA